MSLRKLYSPFSWRVVLVLALVTLSVLTLAACGGASAQEPVKQNAKYENADYRFSFEYPASWKLQEGAELEETAGQGAAFSVGAFDLTGTKAGDTALDGVVCSVYPLTITVGPENIEAVRGQLEALFEQLLTQAGGIKVEQELRDTKIAGFPTFYAVCSFPKDGVEVLTHLYFVFAGDHEYQLVLQGAKERWEELKPSFELVTSSFAVKQ